jgi:hypothetical protein
VGNPGGQTGGVLPTDQTATANVPIASASVAELTAALTPVLSKGLPIREVQDGAVLPNLRSVYARAVVPSELASRVQALNELLPRLIATIADPVYREAVQTLFGLAPGSRGTTHTDRRRRVAVVMGYSAEHVRSVIEAHLVEAVAVLLQSDLLRYHARVQRAVESLEPTGDTPRLDAEHLTHEEELVSRIWQHVYGLRAELIAFARLDEQEGFQQQAADHRQAALREEATLQALLQEYSDTYGKSLIKHGQAEFAAEALERLAGWRL